MAKAFVGGGLASVVGQTIIVPFDVIGQHLMIIGQKADTKTETTKPSCGVNPLAIRVEGRSKAQIVSDIVGTIYARDGLKGYYRGYGTSLCTYVPSSASWWTFYHFFQDLYMAVLPTPLALPHTALQCMAAMSSGCASCFITNPLDLVSILVYDVYMIQDIHSGSFLHRSELVYKCSGGHCKRLFSSSGGQKASACSPRD